MREVGMGRLGRQVHSLQTQGWFPYYLLCSFSLYAHRAIKAQEEEDADPEDAATEVVDKAMEKLLSYTKIEENYDAPPPRTLEDDIRDAQLIRDYMDAHNKTAVCACCSRRRERDDVRSCPLSEIPNSDLLSSDTERFSPTPELPRDSLTTFRSLCLQVGC
jgi:hypothetical protein